MNNRNGTISLVIVLIIICCIFMCLAQYFSYKTADQPINGFWSATNSTLMPIKTNWLLVGFVYFCILTGLAFSTTLIMSLLISAFPDKLGDL